MENNQKYELIVKIKDLLIKTKIENREELENNELISLNASKVLELIYSNSELGKEFYEKNVSNYKKLIQNEKQYTETQKLRQKQILSYIPNEYIKDAKGGLPDYIINISALFNQPYAEDIEDFFLNDLIQNTKSNICFSIFQYVDRIRGYFDANIIPTHVFDYEKQMKMYVLFTTIDNDEYRKEIACLYDYFYLFKYELLTGMKQYFGVFIPKDSKLYLYIAYRKVLNDFLGYVYGLDLTTKQKKELEISQKINSLPDALYQTFKLICDTESILTKEIAKARGVSRKTVEIQIEQLCGHLEISNGIKAIRKYIKDNREFIGIL